MSDQPSDHRGGTREDQRRPGSRDRRWTTRRGFLSAVGIGVTGAAVAACTSNDASDTGSTGATVAEPGTGSIAGSTAGSTRRTAAADATGDLDIVAVAAGLEVLAVQTCTAASAVATAAKPETRPEVLVTYLATAGAQHQAALDAWNDTLKRGGRPEVTRADPDLEKVLTGKIAKATNATGAALVALEIEQIVSATYQKAVPTLVGQDAIQLAGSIEIIDAQHVAILLFLLGRYPVPDSFTKTDQSA